MDFAGLQQRARLLIEQIGRAIGQIALIDRQKRQVAGQDDAARLLFAVRHRDMHVVMQRHRLHHHADRVIPVVTAAGHVQRQIDFGARLHHCFGVRDFIFLK